VDVHAALERLRNLDRTQLQSLHTVVAVYYVAMKLLVAALPFVVVNVLGEGCKLAVVVAVVVVVMDE